MEIALTFSLVLVLIAVGAVVILRLQRQRAERTAAFVYSRPLTGRRSAPLRMVPPTGRRARGATPSERQVRASSH